MILSVTLSECLRSVGPYMRPNCLDRKQKSGIRQGHSVKGVRMIRKYYNLKLLTNPRHREVKPQNIYSKIHPK